jgi:3-oxoacyl-[acyl-carrier protein] reductase
MSLPSFRLDGQVALVTGASRGIGRAILHALAASGATVIGTATSEAGADAITAGLAEAGFTGRGLVLNVTDEASVEATLKNIEAVEGAVGILINNAGITRDTLLLRMKSEDWDAILNTNLSSVFRLSKAVLRGMMKARTGRIISIASIVGQIGNAGQANYAAAKAGIIGFTRSLAREVASRGITANVVAPGFIDTDMTRALSDEQRSALSVQIPLARLGSVDDIAAAVVFLASPAGGYITGETLSVNGGMHMP